MTVEEIEALFPPNYSGNAQISDLRQMLHRLVDSGEIGKEELRQLNDVEIINPEDKSLLVWDENDAKWKDEKIWLDEPTQFSVASRETPNPENFDFQTLEEALTWAQKVSVTGVGIIMLNLEDGTHYLERNPDIPRVGNNDIAAYEINHTHLFITGSSKDNCLITISPDIPGRYQGFVFRVAFSKLSFSNVTIDYSAGGHPDIGHTYFIRSNNAYLYLYHSNFIGGSTTEYIGYFLYQEGSTWFYFSTVEIKNWSIAVIPAKGGVFGYMSRTTFENCSYDIYHTSLISSAGTIVISNLTRINVDHPRTIGENDGRLITMQSDKPQIINNTRAFATANRPILPPKADGNSYFDTDLNKPIWWNGIGWVNSNGDIV